MSIIHKFKYFGISSYPREEKRDGDKFFGSKRNELSLTINIPFIASFKDCALFQKTLRRSYVSCEEYSNWRTFKDPFPEYAYVDHSLHLVQGEEQVEIVALSPSLSEDSQAAGLFPRIFSTVTFNANEICEDRLAVKISECGDIYAAVFDGHGGWQAAEYAQKRLYSAIEMELENMNIKADFNDQIEKAIKRAFGRVEREFIYLIKQAFEAGVGAVSRIGSCALVALIKDKTIFVANAGDCRAVLGRKKSSEAQPWEAIALSSDHNVREPNEQLKLRRSHPAEQNVFFCKRPGVCYVKGCLQPTRSFGDAYLKYPEFNGPPYSGSDRSRGRHIPPPYTPPYITAQPEVQTYALSEADEFLILGTDGLWDFLSNEEAVAIVAQGIHDGEEALGKLLLQAALKKAAQEKHISLEELQNMPAGKGRRSIHDDTTIVIIKLKDSEMIEVTDS